MILNLFHHTGNNFSNPSTFMAICHQETSSSLFFISTSSLFFFQFSFFIFRSSFLSFFYSILGLFGGKERLPSLAFNTRENLQIPFPEELPINRDTLIQFCADFISGKLKSVFDTTEMAKKVLQSVKPISTKNKVQRKEKKKAPKHVQGISEQYEDGSAGDVAITAITNKNFEEIVMNDADDVVLMLHAKGNSSTF